MAVAGADALADAKQAIVDDVDLVCKHMTGLRMQPPGPGPRPLYSESDMEVRMAEGSDYLGVAVNIFAINLKRLAVAEQYPSLADLDKHAEKYFNVTKALKSKEEGGSPMEHFQHPVSVVAVSGAKNPGPHGEWRKISMDLQTLAFIRQWAK